MSNGKTIKVKGSYTGAISSFLRQPTATDSVNLDELADAVFGRGESRKALGAYRNLSKRSDEPRFQESVVRVVLGENSAYCIAPGQKLALWRSESQAPLSLTLRAGKENYTISWPGGAAETELVAAVLKAKPRRLVISGDELERSTRVRLWYGEAGETPGEQLVWYHSRGCDMQFESALTFYQTF
ncbi:MAG: hypothetical protein AB2598_08320 [Candidatus Thiodiazotropha sp.]